MEGEEGETDQGEGDREEEDDVIIREQEEEEEGIGASDVGASEEPMTLSQEAREEYLALKGTAVNPLEDPPGVGTLDPCYPYSPSSSSPSSSSASQPSTTDNFPTSTQSSFPSPSSGSAPKGVIPLAAFLDPTFTLLQSYHNFGSSSSSSSRPVIKPVVSSSINRMELS